MLKKIIIINFGHFKIHSGLQTRIQIKNSKG